MTIQLDRQLTFHEQRELMEQVQSHLLVACLPQHARHIQSITPIIKSQTLGEVINDILKLYCTQRAGGFEVSDLLSRTEIKERLTKEIISFDGFVLGVESSSDSRLPIEGTHCAEVSVYNRYLDISPQMILRTNDSGKQKMKLHAIQYSEGQTIWLGHTSSGTRNVVKSKINQELLKVFVNGMILQDQCFNRERDIFFGDVNFDTTDTNVLERLCQWSRTFDVQFVLPRVRVTKTRYGNRPFANNQMHKDYTQIAESMLAVVPNHLVVQPLDEDGLIVVRNGIIQTHCFGQPSSIVDIDKISWVPHNAFSDAIPLDHKPIYCMIGTEAYQFHNWMDFGGAKGIRAQSWYHEERLIEEEKKLMTYLKLRFPSV